MVEGRLLISKFRSLKRTKVYNWTENQWFDFSEMSPDEVFDQFVGTTNKFRLVGDVRGLLRFFEAI